MQRTVVSLGAKFIPGATGLFPSYGAKNRNTIVRPFTAATPATHRPKRIVLERRGRRLGVGKRAKRHTVRIVDSNIPAPPQRLRNMIVPSWSANKRWLTLSWSMLWSCGRTLFLAYMMYLRSRCWGMVPSPCTKKTTDRSCQRVESTRSGFEGMRCCIVPQAVGGNKPPPTLQRALA